MALSQDPDATQSPGCHGAREIRSDAEDGLEGLAKAGTRRGRQLDFFSP